MAASGRAAVRVASLVAFLTVCIYSGLLGGRAVSALLWMGLLVATFAAFFLVSSRTGVRVRPWVLYLLGFDLFLNLRALEDEAGIRVRAAYAIHADRLLFDGTLPTRWLQEQFFTAGRMGALDHATFAVYLSYFFVPHLVAFALWRIDAKLFRRWVVSVLAVACTGVIVSLVVPTAPPWLGARLTHGAGIARVFAASSGGSGVPTGGPTAGNAVAAMPSIHLALTVLVLAALWRWPKLRLVGCAYVLAMAFSLVYMGEHYVIDELAGAALAAAVWRISRGRPVASS